jgi:hypothetical protein
VSLARTYPGWRGRCLLGQCGWGRPPGQCGTHRAARWMCTPDMVFGGVLVGSSPRQIVSDHSVCSLQRRGRRAARKVACGCTMGACVGVARVTAHCAASYGYMRCVCTALTVVAAREAVLLVQQLLPLEHGGCAFVAAVLAVCALSAANGGHPRCLSVICASANAMGAAARGRCAAQCLPEMVCTPQ